jgi:hypothetical protein
VLQERGFSVTPTSVGKDFPLKSGVAKKRGYQIELVLRGGEGVTKEG